MIFELVDDCGLVDAVRVAQTSTGKGVFAMRDYPATAVIGEITGHLIRDRAGGSEYSFDLENNLQLEPAEPFRYVNHSCDPNCEFDWTGGTDPTGSDRRVYIIALRKITRGEQITIDYNWPASCAIPCVCRSLNCRGWIVSLDELNIAATRSERMAAIVDGAAKKPSQFH